MTELTTFQLGRWRVDPSRNQLIDGRNSVTLEPRVMDVLVALAEAGTATRSRADQCPDRLAGQSLWRRPALRRLI